MPSITEASRLQGIGTGVIRHALETLTADGLIVARRNQTTVVAGERPTGRPAREDDPAQATTAVAPDVRHMSVAL